MDRRRRGDPPVVVGLIRRLGAVVSAAWLGVLLVGPPVALARFFGWPLPDHLPDHAELEQWLTNPVTPRTIVNAFVCLLWLLWAWIVLAVVAEVVIRLGRLRRRLRMPRFRVGGLVQTAASGLAGAAVIGLTGETATAGPPAVPPAPTAPTTPTAGTVATPADPTTPAATRPPASLPADATGDVEFYAAADGGIQLPHGGWVPVELAAAVAAASAAAWAYRRASYQPRPPTGVARSDPDLAPDPPTVAAIRAALTRRAANEATAPPVRVLVGVGDLPAGGVGLTGPGAADAARGILATAVFGRPGTAAPVITTAADWNTLHGQSAAGRPPSGITIVDTLDEAQAAAAHHLLTHTDRGTATRGGNEPAHLVLLAGTPDPPVAARLAVAFTLAASTGTITGVFLGPWPHGPTWHIDPDGSAHRVSDTAQPFRVAVLTATAFTDLLTVTGVTTGIDEHSPRPEPSQAGTVTTPDSVPESIDAPPLRLAVLGEPTVHHTVTDTVIQFDRSAAIEVLVLLAVHPAGRTTSEIAAAVWPDVAPHAAERRLHTTLTSLRTTLRTAAGVPGIIRHHNRYRLNPAWIDTDLWHLRTAVNRAAGTTDPHSRRDALHTAIAAYTGDLADGEPWPWIDPARETTRRHVIDAYIHLADTTSDPHHAQVLLDTALRTDPTNENLRRRSEERRSAAVDDPVTIRPPQWRGRPRGLPSP